MENIYKTLRNEIYDVSGLSKEHQEILNKVYKKFEDNPDWLEFKNFWRAQIGEIRKSISGRLLVNLPLYRICQDLTSRLGIQQGEIRTSDYRDQLADIIRLKYHSRYEFCKEVKIDESYLSKTLNKDSNISIKKLESILSKVGYEIRLVPIEGNSTKKVSDALF